jgi:hypothetical protein
VPSNAESATDHGPWLYRSAFLMETLDVTGVNNGALFIVLRDAPCNHRRCAGALGHRIAAAGRRSRCRGSTVTRDHRDHVRSQGGDNGCIFYHAPLRRRRSLATDGSI